MVKKALRKRLHRTYRSLTRLKIFTNLATNVNKKSRENRIFMTKVLILDHSKSMRKTLGERLAYRRLCHRSHGRRIGGFRNVSSNGLRRSPHRRQQQCFAARNSLYRTRGRGRQPDSARRHRIPRRCDGLPANPLRHQPSLRHAAALLGRGGSDTDAAP